MSRLTEILNGLVLSEGLNATRLNFDDEALEPLIQDLYQALLDEVIGVDENRHPYDLYQNERNKIRAELHQKLAEFCGVEGKNDNN